MKIGFDAKRIVRNVTGLGSYARTLVNDLSAIAPDGCQLCLYAPDEGRDELRNMVTTAENVQFVYPHSSATNQHPSLINRLRGTLWRTHGIVKQLQQDGIQLYHGLSGELPVGIKKSGIKTVVTIHDLIFLRHPEYYKWIDTKFYAWKFRKTIAEADRIIAISECTKRDIMFYGGVKSEKIDLIYQSCGTRFKQPSTDEERKSVREKYHLPDRYIINVGSIEERKNVLLAVKTLRYVPEDVSLVIVGRRTPYTERVEQYAREHNMEHRVRIFHGVPFADLPALYQQAEVCVYPSRYEGFGIPIIEAIQSGLPVVACTGSCLMEAGGNANIYVDPDDVSGMAEGICQSLKGAEGREERIAKSRQYIQRFEGNNVAEQVLNVYRKLL
ncbi:MAG: glycosyltransferase family 4 protein [Prevotella sp.]|nr:glycosyltransferase family 4 protein [Prevotella sp.]